MAAPPPLRHPTPSNIVVRGSASGSIQCCCGRPDCALLRKNCNLLDTVEKDVHTAAQLGQALLARHEAYMADAERDRQNLTSRIERLEMAKQELEVENALKIEENRNLLDQLEMLNGTVHDSDAKIRSLEASLLSSQQAVRRLESASQRAEAAERHLALMEEDQDRLQAQLSSSKEDARSHAQRCREAQRGIMDMQDQLERIEAEAKEERERHDQVIGRMERQREIEKQLDTAAGRLKGAAATKGLQSHTKPGGQIVGHFVRDLLQDNASLQLGIAELREMLMSSNDEIHSLREQLRYHQPLPDHAYSQAHQPENYASTLKGELEDARGTSGTTFSQELHVHHHYHHQALPSRKDKKPRKKRLGGMTPAVATPPAPSTPISTAGSWQLTHSPSAPALLADPPDDMKTTMSVPLHPSALSRHWSTFPDQPSEFASSVSSSPRSTNKRHSMFDQVYFDNDLPSPTTSFDPTSPTLRMSTHHKRPSETSFQSLSAVSVMDIDANTTPQINRTDDTIPEEDEDAVPEANQMGNLIHSRAIPQHESFAPPSLHRTVSHESIMSLTGGLDIHTLKARPSQMTLRPLGGADAVVTGVVAQPTLSRGSTKRSDVALRDHFVYGSGTKSPNLMSSPRSASGSSVPSTPASGLGRWTKWRPWASPAPSSSSTVIADQPQGEAESPDSKRHDLTRDDDARSGPMLSTNTSTKLGTDSPGMASPPTSAISPPRDIVRRDLNRPTGINQAGSIPGFQAYWAAGKRKGAPARVTIDTFDREALMDGLSSEG